MRPLRHQTMIDIRWAAQPGTEGRTEHQWKKLTVQSSGLPLWCQATGVRASRRQGIIIAVIFGLAEADRLSRDQRDIWTGLNGLTMADAAHHVSSHAQKVQECDHYTKSICRGKSSIRSSTLLSRSPRPKSLKTEFAYIATRISSMP
jgi:hypothetical protein